MSTDQQGLNADQGGDIWIVMPLDLARDDYADKLGISRTASDDEMREAIIKRRNSFVIPSDQEARDNYARSMGLSSESTDDEIRQITIDMERMEVESISTWRATHTLSEDEITELARLEYHGGVGSLADQVRRYFLRMKLLKNHDADLMLAEARDVFAKSGADGTETDQTLKALMPILIKYCGSNFVLYFNGKSYLPSNHNIPRSEDGKS